MCAARLSLRSNLGVDLDLTETKRTLDLDLFSMHPKTVVGYTSSRRSPRVP